MLLEALNIYSFKSKILTKGLPNFQQGKSCSKGYSCWKSNIDGYGCRPVAKIKSGGGGGGMGAEPQKWTFCTQKVDFLTFTPPLLQKAQFLTHFVAKSGPFARFGGALYPPGYGPVWLQHVRSFYKSVFKQILYDATIYAKRFLL